jgi:selenocysteine-specific elongation factor
MKHLVIGTAGHVDHGKTSLIKALTGIDTDRLKEEKQRGITIELGFASLVLPSGQILGIVDVPGHEKFIKNMVAGASGIDLVMMVIAADEGIMPQTKEHLQICSLLGISKGIIALTKIDLVEREWLELVKTEIEEFFQQTFLQDAPVIPISVINNKGIQDLISAIDTIVRTIPEKTNDHIFRLPIDRVFTIKGFGTVATGTVVSGHIGKGEDVQILPANTETRIRGIQIHNQSVEKAHKGQRAAINLQGIEKSALTRGDVMSRPYTIWPSQRMDVFLEFLPSNTRNLKNRTLVRLHAGTSERMARVILLEKDELTPGQTGWAQLVLADQDVVVAGDRFVLRSYSPVTTIGGGQIIDPWPTKHKRMNPHVIEDLILLKDGTLKEKIFVILQQCGYRGTDLRTLTFRLGTYMKKIQEELEKLLHEKKILLLDSENTTVIASDFFKQLEDRIQTILDAYHKNNPLREGMAKEELKASLEKFVSPKLFNVLLNDLQKRRKIASEKELIRLTGHQVELSGDLDALRHEIIRIYKQAGLTPPALPDVINKFNDQKKRVQNIIHFLLKDGGLVKISEELVFLREVLDQLQSRYTDALVKEGKATPARFKELTGLSRKYIIPLMEYFDTIKLTVRIGDHRVLRKKS